MRVQGRCFLTSAAATAKAAAAAATQNCQGGVVSCTAGLTVWVIGAQRNVSVLFTVKLLGWAARCTCRVLSAAETAAAGQLLSRLRKTAAWVSCAWVIQLGLATIVHGWRCTSTLLAFTLHGWVPLHRQVIVSCPCSPEWRTTCLHTSCTPTVFVYGACCTALDLSSLCGLPPSAPFAVYLICPLAVCYS
jgi:hypothetical protein